MAMECTELPSLCGVQKLLVNGSVFRLDSKTERHQHFRWVCDRDSVCPARLTTVKSNGSHIIVEASSDMKHSHETTIHPMDVVEFVQIKAEPDPDPAAVQLDSSLECSIVLAPTGHGKKSVQQLCVSKTRLYNMRRNSPVDRIFHWECANREQHRCGSRISTCFESGSHFAVEKSFLDHSNRCDRLQQTAALIAEETAAKNEPMECDYEQPCKLQTTTDGGREMLTVGEFSYYLESMRNMRYQWLCIVANDDLPCAGSISSTIVAGRHVVLSNTTNAHSARHQAIIDAQSSDLKNGTTTPVVGCSKSTADDVSLSADDCPMAHLQIEHSAPDSPVTDNERFCDDDDDDDDEDYVAHGAGDDRQDGEDDDDSDDEDDQPIARLLPKIRQEKQAQNTFRPQRMHRPEEFVPSFTIPTTRGNEKLCVEGYVYYQERKPSGGRSYWACARRKNTQCTGRLVTVMEGDKHVVQSVTMRTHNHEPTNTNADQVTAMAQLRKLAIDSKSDAATVVATVVSNCTTKTRDELPDEKSLIRKVKRIRAQNGVQEVDDDNAADDGDAAADDEEPLSERPVRQQQASRYMDLDPDVPIVCSTVPSRRGNEKLCVLGYVYHLERKATNNSFHWACERRKRYDPPCLARVVTHLDEEQHHVIDRRRGVRTHNHNSPPDDAASARRPSRRPYNADEMREAESKRLLRQLETNSVIPCTTIPTARGNETLFVQGYTYHCDRRSELFVYWKCVLSKVPTNRCPGRVTTTMQGDQCVVLSATLREHTHEATDVDQERYRACAQLRQLAQETQLDADSIIATVLADCSEECRQKLGSMSVLKKKVVRARKGEDRASKLWREQMLSPLERERYMAVLRLKDMARKTTMDAKTIVAAVLADCSTECRTKLGNVIELRKKVGRTRVAQAKREAKLIKKAAKAAQQQLQLQGQKAANESEESQKVTGDNAKVDNKTGENATGDNNGLATDFIKQEIQPNLPFAMEDY